MLVIVEILTKNNTLELILRRFKYQDNKLILLNMEMSQN